MQIDIEIVCDQVPLKNQLPPDMDMPGLLFQRKSKLTSFPEVTTPVPEINGIGQAGRC
jgi:hypothetical protein